MLKTKIGLFLLLFCLVIAACQLGGCAGASADNGTEIEITGSEPPTEELLISGDIAEESEGLSDITETGERTDTEGIVSEIPAASESNEATESAGGERVLLRRFLLEPYEIAKAALDEAGLSASVSYEYSTYAEGTVIRVDFQGDISEDRYSVLADYPISLVVSLGTAPEKYARRNVKALDEKRIYLTFDDGPGNYTEEFLRVLSDYNVHATFFVVGEYAAWYPDRLKAIADAGHKIGCHSYSHDYDSLYASGASVQSEVEAWERAVKNALGALPEYRLFRYPGGSNTGHVLDKDPAAVFRKLKDLGFHCFDWTLADNDRYLAEKKASQTMDEYLMWSFDVTLSAVERNPERPKIMLMHDSSAETLRVLPQIIGYLQERGYSFGTLDELDGDWLFYS